VERLGTLWLGLVGRAKTRFKIDESGGTTEYAVTVSVTNRRGVDWKGYQFSLGLGGDSPIDSRAGDGFGFEVSADDPMPESDGLLSLHRRSEDVLDFTGRFRDNTSATFSFSLDVPDRLAVRQVWLFEQPTPVPEPGGFAVLAGGLGALALSRYHRARKPHRAG
jgi:hypothetical protein